MAGELAHSTAHEIDEYAAAAAAARITTLHFYSYEERVSSDVWAAVKRA